MGWAGRLKKNKRACASCEKERHLPHFIIDVGAMCDECYRKMTRVLDRIDGKQDYQHKTYDNGVWDSWTEERW